MSFKVKVLPLALAQIIAGGAIYTDGGRTRRAQETATDAPVTRVEITGLEYSSRRQGNAKARSRCGIFQHRPQKFRLHDDRPGVTKHYR